MQSFIRVSERFSFLFLFAESTKQYILFALEDDFTEDVYFMHEELVQELEAQYEMNRSLYEQIEAWNELFLEFQEFEVRFLSFLLTIKFFYRLFHSEKRQRSSKISSTRIQCSGRR